MTWLYLAIGSWLGAFVPAQWYFTTVGPPSSGSRAGAPTAAGSGRAKGSV